MRKLTFVLAIGALLPGAQSVQGQVPTTRPDTMQPARPTPPRARVAPVRPRDSQPLGVPVETLPRAGARRAPMARGRAVLPSRPAQPVRPVQPLLPGQARGRRVQPALPGRAGQLQRQAGMQGELARRRAMQQNERARAVARARQGVGAVRGAARPGMQGRALQERALMERLPRELNLSEKQITRMREIREEARREMAESQKEQRDEMQKEQQRMNQRRQKLMEEMRKDQMETQKKLMEVLTSEQRRQLEQMRARGQGGRM